MQLAVIGSRTFDDYALLCTVLDGYPVTRLISSGARGADLLAGRYAKDKGLDLVVFKPDYERFGKSAPFVSNSLIVDAAEQEIAFWDGKSPGTAHALDYARRKAKPVRVIAFPPAASA
jgi:hypothetical protein